MPLATPVCAAGTALTTPGPTTRRTWARGSRRAGVGRSTPIRVIHLKRCLIGDRLVLASGRRAGPVRANARTATAELPDTAVVRGPGQVEVRLSVNGQSRVVS